MSERVYNLGGGIPPGWSVQSALANRGTLPDRSIQKTLFSDKLLVGAGNFMDPARWVVRDQGVRGTCNAFAIAAAEELVETNQTSLMSDLSEEFLYAHLRRNIFEPFGDTNVNLNAIDQDQVIKSGGTFLIGALTVMELHGICVEEHAEYDKDKLPINYSLDMIPIEAVLDAAQRRRSHGTFDHDITIDPSTGQGRFWNNGGPNFLPSVYFAEKLQQGLPVAASFAILSGIGKDRWFGKRPTRRGIVEYPGDAQAALLRPIGGHTVCLIGVRASFEEADNPGYFLFRNSYGEDGFASKAPRDGLSNLRPAPGYGVISARDVDRYCWEYITRADGNDGLPRI